MSLSSCLHGNPHLNSNRALSPAARASFWYAICGALQKGIGIIVIPVYTRIMDPGAYGTYTVFQSWFSLIFVFTSLGLANYVFNNGMLKYKNDRDGFSSAMLGLSGAVTLVFVTVFLRSPRSGQVFSALPRRSSSCCSFGVLSVRVTSFGRRAFATSSATKGWWL